MSYCPNVFFTVIIRTFMMLYLHKLYLKCRIQKRIPKKHLFVSMKAVLPHESDFLPMIASQRVMFHNGFGMQY